MIYWSNLDQSYLGMVRFTVPTGKISIDFPQNLFFHLTSEEQIWATNTTDDTDTILCDAIDSFFKEKTLTTSPARGFSL